MGCYLREETGERNSGENQGTKERLEEYRKMQMNTKLFLLSSFDDSIFIILRTDFSTS